MSMFRLLWVLFSPGFDAALKTDAKLVTVIVANAALYIPKPLIKRRVPWKPGKSD